MDFRIADTFTDSLARLTGDEQKAVKTTAFDLQVNPASPGMQFHKLGKARGKNFWSVRVNADIRLIVHKSDRCPSSECGSTYQAESVSLASGLHSAPWQSSDHKLWAQPGPSLLAARGIADSTYVGK